MKITSVVRLPDEDSGMQQSIARLHNFNIDAKKQDKSRFFRREPVIIRNQATNKSIVRYPMGNKGGISIKKSEVALDYDAITLLGVDYKKPCLLVIERASRFELYKWFWFHADLTVQLSTRLGLTGIMLAIVSFIVSIISML